jgi:thioredoxin-like negative regulator of GroEL
MLKNQKFRALLYIVALLVVFQTQAFAKDEWINIRSKNFNLVGNASEKDIRKVATKLEQFRESFRMIFAQMKLNSAIPTNVVVFKSASSYKPYKPKRADGKIDEWVAGYFQSGEDVNYITISTEGEDADTYGTIFHEYVHFMVDTTFGKSDVPPWFNEGLAEYYQTYAIEEDQKVKLGLPQSGHLNLLQQTKLIPLETLFKISNYSLHQNGNHSRSIFYAQSWALIHYLVQTGKSEGLSKFLSLSLKNTPPETAFQDAFQMNYAQMEKELKKYVAQSTYKYHIVTLKNKLTFDNEMQVAPMSEADSNTYLGDLMYHTHRYDDAEPLLQKAVQLAPNSSMANTTYGMVKIRQRKFAEAKNYLDKAISDDQKNHAAFYQYAYLLSRESYDDFGYVSAFPKEKATRMRELLQKAIALNPGYTESYELLAFISLVNNENLDESIANLQKAMRYQPGNQRYAIRIAEIYARQEKYKEAAAIAEKIANTTDDQQVKSQSEKVLSQIRQQQNYAEQAEKSRKDYETMLAEAKKNGNQVVVLNRRNEKPMSDEEIAKIDEEARMRSINQQIKKVAAGENQVVGRVQKIECKSKSIVYTVKTDGETFTLTSKDFQGLSLMAFLSDAENAQVSCNANLSAYNSVLTYKLQPDAKNANRGELFAIDFVPDSFRFIDVSQPDPRIVEAQKKMSEDLATREVPDEEPQRKTDMETARRDAMMRGIKDAMHKLQPGEKQQLGFIEKIECNNKGMIFSFKTATSIIKLTSASPQAVQLHAFTPEVSSVQFGCGLKQLDIPVVFTYKETTNQKNASGELTILEFMPKSFTLE